MKQEYDHMMKLQEENKTKLAKLGEDAKKLTSKDDINANKREQKMLTADMNYAKKRSDELFA